MTVMFKSDDPICLYRVLNESETEYELAMIGWVPKELLEESDREDLLDPVDLYIEVTKNK